jgi:hypothetical protein
VLVEVFPMCSGCRAPHHSGRSALIRAAVQSAYGDPARPSAKAMRIGSGFFSLEYLSCMEYARDYEVLLYGTTAAG